MCACVCCLVQYLVENRNSTKSRHPSSLPWSHSTDVLSLQNFQAWTWAWTCIFMYVPIYPHVPAWVSTHMHRHASPGPVPNSGWWCHQPCSPRPNTQTSLSSSFFPSLTLTSSPHSQPIPEYFSNSSSPGSPSPPPQLACSPPSTHPPHSGNQNDLSQSQI